MPNTVANTDTKIIHVAVGVIRNHDHDILITKRPNHVHQGGLWEFPGGKVEANETVNQALTRELAEEVGIQVLAAQPLIKINFDYGDKQVLLDVWQVLSYDGQPYACENQAMRWVTSAQLKDFSFPKANDFIIKALHLPKYYPIIEGQTLAEVMENCQKLWRMGKDLSLLQLRIKLLAQEDVLAVSHYVVSECQRRNIRLMVNADLAIKYEAIKGLHLTSQHLMACQTRPDNYELVSASCHNLAELKHAEFLGLDFAVLAAVQQTKSHPGQPALGWDKTTALISQVNIPVYILGGLCLSDYDKAINAGAQGLAGISTFLT